MIRPAYLSKGDVIGVTAPARAISQAELASFVKFMEEAGFSVRFGEHLSGRDGQFSGTVEERLTDLHEMISAPSVRAIFAARGGYGTAQLLPGFDMDLLLRDPKWLIGFSDMTALHSMVNREMESVHAVMPYSLAMEEPQDISSFEKLLKVLKGEGAEYTIQDHPLNCAGSAGGQLIGGNLSVLYSLAATPYEPDYEGKILFLEDLDEYLYHIDRMILNFELRDVFKKVSGLVIGEMSDMHDNTVPFGKNALEIIAERAHKYKVPAMFGFPAGHKKMNHPLIFGRESTLRVEKTDSSLVQL